MKQRIIILAFGLFVTSTVLYAQKISFSQTILNSNDIEITKIRDQWENYIKSCVTNFRNKDNSWIFDYWNKVEIDNRYASLIPYQVFTYPLFIFGETMTFDISKTDDGYYRIKSMVIQKKDTTSQNILAIFNVFAKKVEPSTYEFYTQFEYSKSNLITYSTEHIDYFYPSHYRFNKNSAKEAEKFYSHLIKEFNFQPSSKLKYIVANNVDEANRYIGFDFSIRGGISSKAAYYLTRQNTVLSSQINHTHELVHTVLNTKYPNSPRLFQEGIATFYGGTNGQFLDFHVEYLKDIIKSNPDIDLSQFSRLDKIVDGKTNYFYTVGALIIDYAYKIGGHDKVISLFKYPNTEEGIYDALSSELQIAKGEINDFLKEYIYKYEKSTNANKGYKK